VRVGKNKPRKLLVRLRYEDTTAAVLRASSSLRWSRETYVSQHVYINQAGRCQVNIQCSKAASLRREKRYQRQHMESRSDTVIGAQTLTPAFDGTNDNVAAGTSAGTRSSTIIVTTGQPTVDLVAEGTANNGVTTASDREPPSQQTQLSTSSFR
jgi:hypothetical protein